MSIPSALFVAAERLTHLFLLLAAVKLIMDATGASEVSIRQDGL